jgi:hypothetical protein
MIGTITTTTEDGSVSRARPPPEERPTLVGLHDGNERGQISGRLGGVIAVPFEVRAHPVEFPHAS